MRPRRVESLLAMIDRLTRELREAQQELHGIDEVVARRPALDQPTRRDKIAHAISTAKRCDAAEAENARLREELAKAHASCARWVSAAMAATMPDEFGLAFDPMAPEAWAVTRRRTVESALNARDVADAEVARLREALAFSEDTRTRMRHLLDGVADALHGPARPLHAHDWSDLPAEVADLMIDAARERDAEDQLIDRLARDLRDAQDVIDSAYQSLNWSGARYMDPPDGGDPTLGEMLMRMADDAKRTVAADAEAARLREALREVAHSGVESDDALIGYVTVQIDRATWYAVQEVIR